MYFHNNYYIKCLFCIEPSLCLDSLIVTAALKGVHRYSHLTDEVTGLVNGNAGNPSGEFDFKAMFPPPRTYKLLQLKRRGKIQAKQKQTQIYSKSAQKYHM